MSDVPNVEGRCPGYLDPAIEFDELKVCDACGSRYEGDECDECAHRDRQQLPRVV